MSQNASDRPSFICHHTELTERKLEYDGVDECFGARTSLSRPLGLDRVGVHRDVLQPGQRASLPHAESMEEEMIYVLEGHPDAWINGTRHRLAPGDSAVFAPGTGIIHTIENNTDEPVAFLAIGEHRTDNQWVYPGHPERRTHTPEGKWWEECPSEPAQDDFTPQGSSEDATK